MRDTVIAIHYEKEIGSPDFVFPLTFDLEREGEQWTGTCLEFGTSTFGDTLDEVRKDLQEAVTLQLNEAERLGFISDYLEENRVPLIRFADTGASSDSPFTLASA
jgi:predicted RNase H-like HicB family nuclease